MDTDVQVLFDKRSGYHFTKGGKLAPKLVYFVLRKELLLNLSEMAPWSQLNNTIVLVKLKGPPKLRYCSESRD